MFCVQCGSQVAEGQRFCPSCGKTLTPTAAGAAPMPVYAPAAPRVTSHIKLLGILWLVLSALHMIPGLFLLGISGTMRAYFPPDVPIFVPELLHFIALALTVGASLGLIVGWGLLTWKSWARMFAIVLGILHLINFPFGTALGIYTLWVLLPAESEREYQQRSAVAV